MSKYKIESGIKIPPIQRPRRCHYSEALEALLQAKVGDSVWIPKRGLTAAHISAALHTAARKRGVHVTIRAETKNNKAGHRIWHSGKREEDKQ